MNSLSDSWCGSSLALNDLQSRGRLRPAEEKTKPEGFHAYPTSNVPNCSGNGTTFFSVLLNTQVTVESPVIQSGERNLHRRSALRKEAANS